MTSYDGRNTGTSQQTAFPGQVCASSEENERRDQKVQRKLAVLQSAGHWSYITRPLTQEDWKCFKSMAYSKIFDFVKIVQEYSNTVFESTRHLGTLQEIGQSDDAVLFKQKSNEVLRIVDRDIPAYALYASLFLRPWPSQGKLPELSDPTNYSHLKRERLSLFEKYLDPSDVQRSVFFPNTIRNIHYTLYHYNTLVAELRDRKLIIHCEKLFHKCLYDFSLYSTPSVLTEEMIDEAIEFGLIPECSREELMGRVNQNICETLLFKTNVYGRVSEFYEILSDEIEVVGARAIFEAVSYLLKKNYQQNTTITAAEPSSRIIAKDGKLIRKLNPEVARWKSKIKKVFHYLHKQGSLLDFELSEKSAHELNLIRKVLLLSTWARDYISPVAVSFDEGRNLELIAALHKTCPALETYDTFQRSVNPSKIKDIRRWVDPNNWITPRAAQQAHAYSTILDSAITLHQSGCLNALIGARANSGGGKSTFIRALLAYLRSQQKGDHSEQRLIRSVYAFMKNTLIPASSDGVVSPDDGKALLKRLPPFEGGDKSLNSQVHYESKETVFEPVMQKLREDPEIRYIADQRFLRADDVLKTLVIPSEKKGCPAVLLDIEVPLTHALLRMLARPALGDEPSQASEILVDGYKQSIRQRKAVIDLVKSKEAISEYALVYNDSIVAEKYQGKWSVYDPEAYDLCVEAPEDMDIRIETELSQVINSDMIHSLHRAGRLFEHQIPLLSRWIGWPLGEAVDRNARNQSPSQAASSSL